MHIPAVLQRNPRGVKILIYTYIPEGGSDSEMMLLPAWGFEPQQWSIDTTKIPLAGREHALPK